MPPPSIDHYRFGQIKVDGQTYSSDLIITPEGVVGDWWRASGHSLAPEDLTETLAAQPQVLVIGQGSFGAMRVSAETMEYLRGAGIEVIAQATGSACETYNRLRQQKRLVAALHLTC